MEILKQFRLHWIKRRLTEIEEQRLKLTAEIYYLNNEEEDLEKELEGITNGQ